MTVVLVPCTNDLNYLLSYFLPQLRSSELHHVISQ